MSDILKSYNSGEKVTQLRHEMALVGVDAFLIPQTDEYLGEYIPECAQRLSWLSDFTGSAGIGVVLKDTATVMSDGRYTIQLSQQIDGDVFEAINSQEVTLHDWLESHADKNNIIGYDPKLHTPDFIEKLENEGWVLKSLSENLIDVIWHDQPDAPQSKIFLFDQKYAGETPASKIQKIQTQLKDEKCDFALITLSDSIAWLLNIRANDLPYIPVALSYLILPAQGKAQWFVDEGKLTDDVKNALSDLAVFQPMGEIENFCAGLKDKVVGYDSKRSTIYFKKLFEKNNVGIRELTDPCIHPRACKNEVEQVAMKAAHIRDGVAMVRFLKWFDEHKENERLSELVVEDKLESFRKRAPEYKEPSFNTISGYGSNGAIVHYRADEHSNKVIKKGNLLLLDSGAQYCDGTTDITRTIAIGQPTDEMVRCNTLVLKGHIALAQAKFDAETTGKDLDLLARKALVAQGLNYGHGTGHGVGCYLSVHEEAPSISPRGEGTYDEGMILSNEPGYYKEGAFGIRIESLVLVQKSVEGGLFFETITYAPIDKNLIDVSLLGEDEIEWVNKYHSNVYEVIVPLLNDEESVWLKEATSPLSA